MIGSEIHIDMYDNRLEIVSPGGVYDGKNIQEVDIDKIASVRRNPILADVFDKLDYMERRGSGLKRIKESFKDKNLVEIYSNESSFFVIMKKWTFDEVEKIKDERLDERIKSGLSENEIIIVEFLLENERITNKEVAELTGLSPQWIRKIFVELQNKEVIEAHGEGRGRYYKLTQ